MLIITFAWLVLLECKYVLPHIMQFIELRYFLILFDTSRADCVLWSYVYISFESACANFRDTNQEG